MKRNKYLQTLFINERRKKRKNPPIPHRADGPRPIEQLELLWDEDPLFFAARLRAPRAGGDGPTAVFSCVVTAPEQRREEKKKKKRARRRGEGWRGAKQQSKPCRATTVARSRRSSQIVVVVVVSMSLAPQAWLSFSS